MGVRITKEGKKRLEKAIYMKARKSKQDFATDVLGITPYYLSKLLSGDYNVVPEKAEKICESTGLEWDEVFGWIDEEEGK